MVEVAVTGAVAPISAASPDADPVEDDSTAEVWFDALPLLPDVLTYAAEGIYSGGGRSSHGSRCQVQRSRRGRRGSATDASASRRGRRRRPKQRRLADV